MIHNATMDYVPSATPVANVATPAPLPEATVWNATAGGLQSIWTAPVVQRVATLSVLMVLNLVGNGVIILVVSAAGVKKGLNRVNIFILHLAIGDICVCLVTMTSEIVFVAFGQWVLGPVLCKVIVYAQVITLASTTFILTAMSLDRHQAITDPMNVAADPERKAKRMILAAWIMAFLVAVPQLFIFLQQEKEGPDGVITHRCVSQGYTAEWQRKVYMTWMAVYVLVAPAVIITCCYVRIVRTVWHTDREQRRMSCRRQRGMRRTGSTITSAKIKTIKMTLCIIIGFVTCWTPYFVVTLYEVYTGKSLPDVAYVIAETMALFNSAFNPIVYGFFNLNVKNTILSMLPCSWADGGWSRPSSLYKTEDTYTDPFFMRRSFHRLSRSSSIRRKPNPNRRATLAIEMDNLGTRRKSSGSSNGNRVPNSNGVLKSAV
ncbi:PREDICTED: vasopressin V2 receptor-like [Branchiostoma belcheri]|uniref:Vasopressin V2 receptor-like n=1 Tax=Branchiostoma belcheri TaxID=7741 RepID=A0A6P4Z6Y4_BRABE|nr:PREDICTED: vasopressin V2 receptor-like [Branchiostoma belcheri]